MTLFQKLSNSSGLVRKSAPHEVGKPILQVKNLSVRYESGAALDGVSFELQTGERLAVVGPNGAGKSTLFKVIAGVLRFSEGEVRVFGHEPGGHICIAYVPQRASVDWSFPVTVADVVMMGRIGKIGLFRWPVAKDWKIVNQSLEIVNLSDMSNRQISQLSGGQQQRMFIARALAQEAELMLMDEPFTGLDFRSQEELFGILEELKKRKVTLMVALHDLKLAAEQFDRVMLINHKLMGLGKAETVLAAERLLEVYGSRIRFVPAENGVVVLEDSCCGEDASDHDQHAH